MTGCYRYDTSIQRMNISRPSIFLWNWQLTVTVRLNCDIACRAWTSAISGTRVAQGRKIPSQLLSCWRASQAHCSWECVFWDYLTYYTKIDWRIQKKLGLEKIPWDQRVKNLPFWDKFDIFDQTGFFCLFLVKFFTLWPHGIFSKPSFLDSRVNFSIVGQIISEYTRPQTADQPANCSEPRKRAPWKIDWILKCVQDIIAFVFKFYILFTHSLAA